MIQQSGPSNTSSPSSSIIDSIALAGCSVAECPPQPQPARASTSSNTIPSSFRRVTKSAKRIARDDLTQFSSNRIMKERFDLLKSIIDVRMLRGERPLYDSEIPKDMLALLTNPAEANL